MWFALVVSMVAPVAAACSPVPVLRDADVGVTALEQNLKFIVTGAYREERASMLRGWLDGPGRAVDVLLLSEARITEDLVPALPGWCVYGQGGDGGASPYAWTPAGAEPSPGGLVLGVRERAEGTQREIGLAAGRRFRARPTTLVEGVVARIARYHKGWAEITVDGSRLVWSHTQASYAAHPEHGAGGPRRGRAGQFDDLAEDLGRPERPTLLTGDLNLLDRFASSAGPASRAHQRVALAARVDTDTLARFEAKTGIEFHWFRPALCEGREGSFFGCLFKVGKTLPWDAGARYDRVGMNRVFIRRHPGTRIRHVAIERAGLRLSDHDGLEISIPYGT